MDKKKKAIWDEITRNFYEVSLQERILDALINRWEHIDLIYKILIGVTTTGSAVSGWVIWTQSEFKWIWLILTSAAPVATVFYLSASVERELKAANRILPELTRLRGEYEAIMLKVEMGEMKFDQTDLARLKKLFHAYTIAAGKAPRFKFVSRRFIARVQEGLNSYLRSIGKIK